MRTALALLFGMVGYFVWATSFVNAARYHFDTIGTWP
jgi:hypothetical protein